MKKKQRKNSEKTPEMKNQKTINFTPKPWNQPMNMADFKDVHGTGKELYLHIVQFQVQHGRK